MAVHAAAKTTVSIMILLEGSFFIYDWSQVYFFLPAPPVFLAVPVSVGSGFLAVNCLISLLLSSVIFILIMIGLKN